MHRLHVVSLPHTNTTKDFSVCAYTEKVRKFCVMMHDAGHHVSLYAGEHNEAPHAERYVCMTERERKDIVKGLPHFVNMPFNSAHPAWVKFNERVIEAMRPNLKPRDFICIIGGQAQKPIADAFPGHMTVEFGIGYAGHFSRYRVWESYAWMHCNYGAQPAQNRNDLRAEWEDVVIPGYVEADRFPYRAKRKDYCLFVGRCMPRKGIDVAFKAATAAGRRLIVVGPGDYIPEGADYRGPKPTDEVAKLMGEAHCVIAPTFYIEPFGNVVVEAQMCGTPVITTDWGAFTETVMDGVTGFRCRSFHEFIKAIDKAKDLNPIDIRRWAKSRYSLEVVGPQYTRYFDRLANQWKPEGFWYLPPGAILPTIEPPVKKKGKSRAR